MAAQYVEVVCATSELRFVKELNWRMVVQHVKVVCIIAFFCVKCGAWENLSEIA